MKQQTNRSVPFSPAEDTAMWNWCIQNPVGDSLAHFWEEYRVANNSPRTVKSIRERFRRKVLPLLHLTTFEDSVKLELYKKMRSPINLEYMQRVHGDWDIQLNEHGHVIGYTARLFNILENRGVEAPKAMPNLQPVPQTNLKRSSLESSGPLIPAKHVRFMNPEEAGDNGQHRGGEVEPYGREDDEEEELQMGNFRSVNIKNEPVEFNHEEHKEVNGEEDDDLDYMGHLREHSTDDEEDDDIIQANVLDMYHEQQMQEESEQQENSHGEHDEEDYDEEFDESPHHEAAAGLPTEQSSSSIVSTDIVSLTPFLDAIKETVGNVVEKKLEEAVVNVIRHQLAAIPDHINETIENAVAEKMKQKMDEQKKKAELVDPKPFFIAMKRLIEDAEEIDGMEDIINRLNAAIANLATVEKKVRQDKMELVMNMLLAVLNIDSFTVDDSD